MSKAKPKGRKERSASLNGEAAMSFAPPEAWVAKLQRLVKERDELRTEHERLLTQRAGFFPAKPGKTPEGTASKLKEMFETFGGLQSSSHHYSNLFDFAPVGYVILDMRGQIQEIN